MLVFVKFSGNAPFFFFVLLILQYAEPWHCICYIYFLEQKTSLAFKSSKQYKSTGS